MKTKMIHFSILYFSKSNVTLYEMFEEEIYKHANKNKYLSWTGKLLKSNSACNSSFCYTQQYFITNCQQKE